MAGWKPPSGFNHAKAKFALTGKHVKVDCVKCHQKVTDDRFDNDKDYAKLTGLVMADASIATRTRTRTNSGNHARVVTTPRAGRASSKPISIIRRRVSRLQGKHVAVACDKVPPAGKDSQGRPVRNLRRLPRTITIAAASPRASPRAPARSAIPSMAFRPPSSRSRSIRNRNTRWPGATWPCPASPVIPR